MKKGNPLKLLYAPKRTKLKGKIKPTKDRKYLYQWQHCTKKRPKPEVSTTTIGAEFDQHTHAQEKNKY